MSIGAMKQALDALESITDYDKLYAARVALRTAIHQAETEPVGMLVSDEFDGHRFIPNGDRWPFNEPLYTHPAPGVPDGVMRDAELLNELETLVKSKGTHGLSFDYCKHVEDGYVMEKGFRIMWRHHLGERKPTLREAIDAAMTATQAQKGGA